MHTGQRLERLMELRRLTQGDVAEASGVSQATVSRVLRRAPQRSGAAYLRLCSYIRQQELVENHGPEAVIAAVQRVWDGSERHATALTELIEASRRLWPEMADREDPQSTAQPTSERS